MSDEVYWVLELAVREGERENVEALMQEMVEATRADEPGALNYEWHIGEDGDSVHIYERYADSDAALIHLGNFQKKFARRFLGAMKPRRWIIYGNADERVRDALKGQGAVFMQPFGGFAR